MHERKALMAELADAFVALPGGIGTLEELIEIYTWSYLGIHDKPFAVLNIAGYYDGFTAFLDHAVGAGLPAPRAPGAAARGARRRGAARGLDMTLVAPRRDLPGLPALVPGLRRRRHG